MAVVVVSVGLLPLVLFLAADEVVDVDEYEHVRKMGFSFGLGADVEGWEAHAVTVVEDKVGVTFEECLRVR